MNFNSVNQFVTNMNAGTGYLGQTKWELPPMGESCGGYNCTGAPTPWENCSIGSWA
jgi:hypothetical protein